MKYGQDETSSCFCVATLFSSVFVELRFFICAISVSFLFSLSALTTFCCRCCCCCCCCCCSCIWAAAASCSCCFLASSSSASLCRLISSSLHPTFIRDKDRVSNTSNRDRQTEAARNTCYSNNIIQTRFLLRIISQPDSSHSVSKLRTTLNCFNR